MSSFISQKDVVSEAASFIAAFNQLHDAVIQQGASGVSNFSPTGGLYHRDVTSVPNGSNFQSVDAQYGVVPSVPMVVKAMGATGLPASAAAAIDLQGKLLAHFNDDNSHIVPDLVNAAGLSVVPVPSPSSVTGVSHLLNSCQVFYNAHLTASSASGVFGPGQVQCHVLNDVLNSTSIPTAVGTGTAFTLAGGLASGVSAHLLTGPSVGRLKLVG